MWRWVNMVCAAGLVLAGCSGSDEAVEEGDTVASTEVVETAPAADDESEAGDGASPLACSLDEKGWSQSEGLEPALDLVSVAANDEAVVVVGAVIVGEAQPGGIVSLRSADGLEWEQGVGFPEVTYFGPPPEVAGGPAGFVAVATRNGAAPNTPVVAFSPDGTSWEEIEPETLPENEVAWLSDVFAGPDGFLIVGNHLPNELLAWYSADGRTWSETDLPRAEIGEIAVAPSGSGWMALTSASGVGPGEEPSPVRVWTSTDGSQWSETDTLGVPPPEALMAYGQTVPLTFFGGTWMLALVGEFGVTSGNSRPVVWVSTDDGVTWNEHSVGGDVTSTAYAISDIATTDFGVIVAGSQDRPSGVGESFLHHSSDGVVWQHCWTNPREISEIEPFGDALVAYDAGSGDVYLWNEPSAP